MQYIQKRFPPEGYVPKIYGYGRVSHKNQHDRGNSIEGQAGRIESYVRLRQLEDNGPFEGAQWVGMFSEPKAQSAYSRPFPQRPMGRELMEKLQPADHLVIDKQDRLFRSMEDFSVRMRYFAEHGIRVHIVNFQGVCVDTGTSGGRLLLSIMAVLSEMESVMIGERVRSARSRLRAAGRHDGAGFAFFLKVEGAAPGKKRGGGGRLVFQEWALPLMEKIEFLRTTGGLGYWRIAKTLLCAHGKYPWLEAIKLNRAEMITKIRHLNVFHRAWLEAGKPNINEIKIGQMMKQYLAKKRAERENIDEG